MPSGICFLKRESEMTNRTMAARLDSFVNALVNTRTNYAPVPLSEIVVLGMDIDSNARMMDSGDTYDIVFADGSIASFAKDDCE